MVVRVIAIWYQPALVTRRKDDIMTLTRKGQYWYGTSLEDLQASIVDYSKANQYEATAFASSQCTCGSRLFTLESDDVEGVARRTCCQCRSSAFMGDSGEFAAEAQLERHVCVCDAAAFELQVGVALYAGSSDIRWAYIGARCVACTLVGVFADWKCNGGDAAAFLANT